MTKYLGEDGRWRIKLDDLEMLEMYEKGQLPLRPDQLERLKERLRNEFNDRLR